MQLGSKIFSILKDKGISQKEFSKMTGIAESTICDWKRKGFNPSAGKISAICKALDISPIELFCEDNALQASAPEFTGYDVRISDEEKYMLEIYRNSDSNLIKMAADIASAAEKLLFCSSTVIIYFTNSHLLS